jgi:hypothetical protein
VVLLVLLIQAVVLVIIQFLTQSQPMAVEQVQDYLLLAVMAVQVVVRVIKALLVLQHKVHQAVQQVMDLMVVLVLAGQHLAVAVVAQVQ